MKNNTRLWFGVGVFGALILVVGIFFVHSRTALAPTTTTALGTASTTTTDLGSGVLVTTTGGVKVEAVPTSSGIKPPSLAGPISISASLPLDAQTLLRSKEETLIAQLKQAPARVDLWLDLGIDRKIGGDYVGAAEAWGYVAKAAPSSMSYIAYGNLGDLYMNFLKDYPKSESNYKQAITLSPQTIDYYRNLYTLYKYLYKTNTTAAADILVQGLKANPGNADLLALQKQ